MEAHLTKYRSLIPSLALIFHIIGSTDSELGPVTNEALLRACLWEPYLRSHADRIYSMGVNTEIQSAKLLLKKIKNRSLNNPFRSRDIYRPQWSGLTDTNMVKKALKLLEDHSYIYSIEVEGKSKIATDYYVNPAAFK